MRRSRRHNAAFVRVAVLVGVSIALSTGCRQRVGGTGRLSGEAACRAIDSVFAKGLPRQPWTLRGRAVFDVDQYRVRGQFSLTVTAPGEFSLDFSGTTLLGGHREDISVSLSDDTLRVFDRERARYYQGAEVDRLVEEGTGASGDWGRALGLMLDGPACPRVVAGHRDADAWVGELADGAFRLELSGDRLSHAIWPDPTQAATFRDHLEFTYAWEDVRLVALTAELPVRGWRVRLEAPR